MKAYITTFSRRGMKNKYIDYFSFEKGLFYILKDCGIQIVDNYLLADIIFVGIMPIKSIAILQNYEECLEILNNCENVILFSYDSNIVVFRSSLKNLMKNKSNLIITNKIFMKYENVFHKLYDGSKYKYIYPGYDIIINDNLEKRFIDVYLNNTNIDCSIYVNNFLINNNSILFDEFIDSSNNKFDINMCTPFFAGLGNKYDNYLSRLKYKYINLKKSSYKEVFEMYKRNRICISLPNNIKKRTNWFRERYQMAYLSDCLVIEDKTCVFGKSYDITYFDVNNDNFEDLLAKQKEEYEKVVCLDKDKVIEKMKKIVNI